MLCRNPGTSSSRAPVVDRPLAALYIFDECRVVLLNFLCNRHALVIFVSYFFVADNDFLKKNICETSKKATLNFNSIQILISTVYIFWKILLLDISYLNIFLHLLILYYYYYC